MKTKLLLLSSLLIFISFRTISPIIWELDPVHSNMGFSILHLSVSDIRGSINLTESTINTSNEDFADASISLKADMNTIDTDNEKRDAHLKSPDFFDAAKFPEVTFVSTSFKKESMGKYTISGNLSFHGITKPVTLSATLKSGINPTNNKPISGFKVTGTIKRSDFDISKDTPEAILSDEVAIEANLEFGKKEN